MAFTEVSQTKMHQQVFKAQKTTYLLVRAASLIDARLFVDVDSEQSDTQGSLSLAGRWEGLCSCVCALIMVPWRRRCDTLSVMVVLVVGGGDRGLSIHTEEAKTAIYCCLPEPLQLSLSPSPHLSQPPPLPQPPRPAQPRTRLDHQT